MNCVCLWQERWCSYDKGIKLINRNGRSEMSVLVAIEDQLVKNYIFWQLLVDIFLSKFLWILI